MNHIGKIIDLKNKFLFILFVFCLTFLIGFARAEVSGAFEYIINSDNTISITGYTEEAESIVFPNEIDGLPVVSVSLDSSNTHSQLYRKLTQVTLPDNIIRIDDRGFYNMQVLKSITGLDHIESAGYYAFAQTASLEEVVFSQRLQELEYDCFWGSSVKRVIIPDSITLGSSCFRETYHLEKIELIPTSAPKFAVSDTALYSADMKILYTVFPGKSQTFVVPDSVTTISRYVFSVGPGEVYGTYDVYLGENVTNIDDIAFNDYYSGQLPRLHVVENSVAHRFAIRTGRAYALIGSESNFSIQEKIGSIIEEVITSDMTEYEKAKALNRWICNNVSYDHSSKRLEEKGSIVNALIDGKTICEGYATLYSMLLSKVGIENFTIPNAGVAGSYMEEGHEWNLLKIDGDWTYVDCTWDDTDNEAAADQASGNWFGFNADICYMTHAGLQKSKFGHPETLRFYKPYTSGFYDSALASIKNTIQTYLDNGEMAFTLNENDYVLAGIIMTALQDEIWISGGESYMVGMQGVYIGPAKINCIAFKADGGEIEEPEDYRVSLVNNGIRIDAYEGTDEVVYIPEEIMGYPVVSIGDSAFIDNRIIKEVYISKNVTDIGRLAFNGCLDLESVKLNTELVSIGDSAFSFCYALSEVELPEALNYIGEGAFSNTPIKNISLPKGIKVVPPRCFYYTALSSISFEGEITQIGANAFAGCDFEEFIIPETVISIGDAAFLENNGLTSISIPASVTNIGKGVFTKCEKLKDVAVYTDPSILSYHDGMLFRNNGAILDSIMSWVEKLNVPGTVTEISENAASYSDNLKYVTIGNGVITIGNYAFMHCPNLISVVMEDSVTSIGSCILQECRALNSVVFSDNIEELPVNTLNGCINIQSIHLPVSLKKVETGAICTNEPFVQLPPKLESLSMMGFEGRKLKRLTLPTSLKTLQKGSLISYAPSGSEFWITNSTTSIANGVFLSAHDPIFVCNSGSVAEQYAISSGIKYIAFPSFETTALELCVGSERQLAFKYEGLQEFSTIEWWSTNENVITIENGIVHGIGTGEAEVHVLIENLVELSCTITVSSHTEVIDAAIVPTCTETGLTEGKHCSVCGEVLTAQEIVPANGHTVSFEQSVYELIMEHGEISICANVECGHDVTLNLLVSDEVEIVRSAVNTADIVGKNCGVAVVTAETNDGFGANGSCKVIVHAENRLILPKALKMINEEAFVNLFAEEVVLNDNIESIAARAFADSTKLRLITIPDNVVIADDAFKGCDSLTIICAANSIGQAYAESHKIPYVIR